MNDYVDPVLAHVEAVRQWPDFKDKPIFILGHSMGGLITLFTLFKNEDLFKGAILMGPLLEVDPEMATPVKKFLAKIFQVPMLQNSP
jgi:alpha-beta hydrolase superfamily lysophospholipase